MEKLHTKAENARVGADYRFGGEQKIGSTKRLLHDLSAEKRQDDSSAEKKQGDPSTQKGQSDPFDS